MFAVVDRQQWNTQRAAEPPLSPELQQMFALAHRMGYEMRPIARRFDAPRQTPSPRSSPSKDYRAPFRPRDYSRTKCFSCGQLGHTQVRCPKPDSSLPFRPSGWVDRSDGPQRNSGEPVMHISGTGHWFLEGWIGDHSVEFLVDSGSSVTAISDILYTNLVHAGARVGAAQITARTLRSANRTGIEVLGCSRCSVSFLGLRTEFPIIICSLAAGTDAIIGTDVLGSVLPHTLDIKNGLLFAQGGASLQLHRRDSALSGRVFTVGHSSIPPY